MGSLKDKLQPRRIHLHPVEEPAPAPPPPSPGPPQLFEMGVQEPMDAMWQYSQPWRRVEPGPPPRQRKPCPYVDNRGALYIPTPPGFNTLTVYTSVEAYNHRLEVPVFISVEDAPWNELTRVYWSPSRWAWIEVTPASVNK